VGIGKDATEAFAPWRTTVRGQRIAMFGVTHVLDGDLRTAWTATDRRPGLASAYETDRLVAAVKAARAEADTVVVYVHWGTEGQTCPNEAQPALARTLVGAGADIVVGSHAHRLMGAGRMGNAYVAYGLGNFVFYQDSGPATDSGVLTVTATGRRVDAAAWHPAKLVGELPRPLTGKAAAAAGQAWDRLKGCTGLS
jgi:poly-gamma-glutamate synthesis protein (capsule biosynthesis protein)